ncbi:hypothetical protein [Brachyspira murdochii]|uniref:Lipoprotein n=1 Tax=Brachyspira murdochii TaxID=84378 RepID=A0ABX5B2B3_9SPIR|nr:hypothetical protein [Brachyspira murdochii]PPS20706.1 hypothetical protein DJ52_15230 [Brachyspira murdochii]
MIKNFSSIILISLLAAFFLISCSASIVDSTQPLSNEELIGNGDVIELAKEPQATTDNSIINEFLQNHNGVYYAQYEDGSLDVRYIIDGNTIYNGYGTLIDATRVLLENKLQIYIAGKTTSTVSGYDMNDEMYTLNFGEDGNIYLFANAVFKQETYSSQKGYTTTIGEPIEGLKTYSYNYYYYDYDDSKKYYILIDTSGQIYMDDNFGINYSKASLTNGNVLTITYTQSGGTANKQDLYFYDNKLIYGNTYINNQLQYEKLVKHDLFSTYNGTYKSADNSITLTVTAGQITLSTLSIYDTPIITGNTLIIYQYSSRNPTKEHKIVFSNDKTQAVYTKPDGGGTIVLTKQGA